LNLEDPSDGDASPPGRPSVARLLWAALAYLSFGVGFVGLFLPGLPTAPFVLLAAYAAMRGSERLHARILAHPRLGPLVREWRERGAVSRRAKLAATFFMVLSGVVLVLFSPAPWITIVGLVALATVFVWLWTRPE
jgi:uncharacterized membrane protein YbaN (DUF454 family)